MKRKYWAPGECRSCHKPIVTAMRNGVTYYGASVYGGHGRKREFCSHRCQMRWYRNNR